MLKLDGVLEGLKESLAVSSFNESIRWCVGRKEKLIDFCKTFPEHKQEILKKSGFSDQEFTRIEELYEKHGRFGLQVTKKADKIK